MIEVYFDGAITLNPGGIASYGFVLKPDVGHDVSKFGVVMEGEGSTNNVAEYAGIIRAIDEIVELGWQDNEIMFFGDSNLIVNMVNRDWGWKKLKYDPHPDNPLLRDLLEVTHQKLQAISLYELQWIPREENEEADYLSKRAVKEYKAGRIKMEPLPTPNTLFNDEV